MQRTTLGHSKLEISRIVFGSARYRSGDDAERIRVVHAAIDAGMTSLDTAPLYDFGGVESMLGRAVRGRREGVELLSKVGLRWDDDHGEVLFESVDQTGTRRIVRRDARPKSIRRDVEESLARLGTDRIDLCQIHQPDPLVPIEDSLGELARLAAEGKVREAGISNFSFAEFERSIGQGESLIASNQLHYSLLERSAELEVFPLARDRGVAILAYSPLDAGVLAGKLLAPSPANSVRAADFRFDMPAFQPTNATRINAALREVVEPVAQRHDASLSQVCLAWVLAQPDITGVIAGASCVEQVSLNARASEVALSPEEVRTLGDRFAQIRIDPHAGLGWSRRVRQLARRVRGKLARTIGPA